MAHNRMSQYGSKSIHYVLYTLNDQQHIEWVIRSLLWFYFLHGKSITVTIIDEGSSDDTMAIVSTLSRDHKLDVQQTPPFTILHNEMIHIRLSTPEDLCKLPQL